MEFAPALAIHRCQALCVPDHPGEARRAGCDLHLLFEGEAFEFSCLDPDVEAIRKSEEVAGPARIAVVS